MRKVHRLGPDDDLSGNVITPSSWRAGKELAERILRETGQQQHGTKEEGEGPRHRPSERSPPSPGLSSHLSSSYHDSLDDDDDPHHSLGQSSHAPSDVGSLGREGHGGLRLDARSSGKGTDFDSQSERSSLHDSILDNRPRVAKLSVDMNQLLQELQATSREIGKDVGEESGGVVGKVGSREKVTMGGAAGPATKKTKYEVGKCVL